VPSTEIPSGVSIVKVSSLAYKKEQVKIERTFINLKHALDALDIVAGLLFGLCKVG
jgi:hypothetical protein